MTSTMQTFPKMLKILRENGTPKEKREALTYIRSLCKNTDLSGTIKAAECKELCRLIIRLFTNEDNNIQKEASDTFRCILQDLKNYTLNVFESIMQTNRTARLKIFKLLEGIEDSAVAAAANDKATLNFFNDCLSSIQPTTMVWLAPATCAENIKMLTDIESQSLSEEEKLEEDIVNSAVALLQRLYKVATLTLDSKIQRFDTLVMDKVMMLAYMGHKRQRTPALRVLQQVILTNLPAHIRTQFPNVWASYKAALLSAYYKRMLLLADACELDWSKQWNISIQFLGTDLHRGSVLINNLLSVEERAFKSTDTIIRRQAFLSWKLLIDNFALNPAELATTRRIKLLCIPLNAKNSKTEMIALTKLEVWWHLIIKVYKDIEQFANLIITHYLNFCFGPLGDTPLLSSKCDVVASPGKRFFKTKLVAVDALCQLLIPKHNIHPVLSPILDERLPYCISDTIFQECHQSIIHSVGEALLILAQLTEKELKNRYQISKLLWTNLINYVQKSKMESNNSLYKNIFMIITELSNHMTEKVTIKDLILDCVLVEIAEMVKQSDYSDSTLFDLILKLLTPGLINDMKMNHCEAIKCLLWQYIKPKKSAIYHSNTLQIFNTLLEKLKPLSKDLKNISAFSELWCAVAQILTKFMEDSQDINEGSAAEHQFTTVVQVLSFPFKYIFFDNLHELQETAKTWKNFYKQFDLQADLIATVKPNEVLLNTASIMKQCYQENNKCFSLIISCLDALLNTINYKYLLDDGDTTIIQFIVDLTLNAFTNEQSTLCETILKALSALLITVFGLDTERVVKYLQVSKPVIEIMLSSNSDLLMKEIVNTWETVVSIFRGLNKFLDRDLLQLYKYTIIRAISHSNLDIKTQALSILELIDKLDENVKNSSKDIVAEIMTEIKENECIIKSQHLTNVAEKGQKIIHQVKASGSFLNRKPASPTPTTKKQKGKDEKKVVLPPDPSSQDYVFIKTDVKFDVNRLTEHQKESFKRRRDDIPALYNDLSQSCSQDSQELQEMFNRKFNKAVNVLEKKTAEQKENDKPNCDSKKEKKTVTVEPTNNQKPASEKSDVRAEETKEKEVQEPETQESLNSTKETHYSPAEKFNEATEKDVKTDAKFTEDKNSPKAETVAVHVPAVTGSFSPEEEIVESQEAPSESIVKKLDFESREEFPEDKEQGRSSPSLLDNDKRRSRNITKVSLDSKQEETSPKQEETDAKVVSKSLRRNVRQTKTDDQDKITDENRKGMKRKCASDSDSEGSTQPRRRRKLGNSGPEVLSDSDSTKSSGVENITPFLDGIVNKKSLSQRTKNEISRLRIDMVFDCPPNRRRSKADANAKDQPVPEGKGGKTKSSEGKVVETARRRSKALDKEADVSPTNKKQRRRSAKVDTAKSTDKDEKNDTTDDKVKSMEEKGNSSTEDSKETSSEQEESMIMDAENEKLFVEKDKKSVIESLSGENLEKQEETKTDTQDTSADTETSSSMEGSPQSQDEDFVESSQESLAAKFDKKCNERQCFIKIDKLDNILPKLQEPLVVNEVVVESSKIQNDLTEESQEKQISKEKDDTTAPVQEDENVSEKNTVQQSESTLNDNGNVKTESGKGVSTEHEKPEDSPLRPSSMSSYSSPKSNVKRFSRLKTLSSQGRGAHMLGLVTKQALLENDGTKVDEEIIPKKSKAKDSDYEPLPVRKEKLLPQKDVETGIRTATTGSRQEKIFSNMRSADYLSSGPVKLFSNLKNDGEKISPKMDRHSSDSGSTHGIDKENDGNASPPREREELPILEWSSANPPSLTASPSASILKRQRSSVPEQDQELTTPNKRKRVSFADPPVSKEMGYEIVSAGSPHKVNKMTIRGSLLRKDSPLRLKQSRLPLFQVDSYRTRKDENSGTLNLSDVQLQCERENEILTKIAEELEFPEPSEMNVVDNEMPSTSSVLEKNDILTPASNANKVTITNLSMEVELAKEKQETDLSVSENVNDKVKDMVVEETKDVEIQDSETQQDIFSDVDAKENENSKTSEQNCSDIPGNSIESPKLSSIDSSKDILPKNESKTDSLEDTVDVANLTELNTTESSVEGFCKPIRCSTQKTEMDMLPIPDTNLATQDTQNVSQVNAEISKPELLDSTTPICPSLVSCKEPISAIVGDLTNPLWVQYLTTYFGDRGLRTIGDLARLSEREVDRIPVKGSPKIDFVRKILRRFENTLLEGKTNETNFCGIAGESTVTVFSMTEQNQTMPRPENSELTCSTPLSKASSVASKMCVIDAASTTVSVAALNDTTESSSADVSAGTPFIAPRTLQGPPTKMSRTSTVSASAMNFSTSTTNQPLCRPISSTKSMDSFNTSNEPSTASESACNPAMQTTVSIGTDTDFISPTRLSTKTASKSVASQMSLDELLDEIDVNLVLESAVKRCSPENLLTKFKQKLKHMPEAELITETIRMLDVEGEPNCNELTLKSACRACGVNKVLLRLPDIFGGDKEFFAKVLNAYRKKITPSDCLKVLDIDELKDAFCQKCTSSELAEMLTRTLKDEEKHGIKTPMTELSSLGAMLRRFPREAIISNIVSNEELIPAKVVMDIALRSNSLHNIAEALTAQPPIVKKTVFDKLWSTQDAVSRIETDNIPRDELLEIFKAVSSKLNDRDLLDAYHSAMKAKLDEKMDETQDVSLS